MHGGEPGDEGSHYHLVVGLYNNIMSVHFIVIVIATVLSLPYAMVAFSFALIVLSAVCTLYN